MSGESKFWAPSPVCPNGKTIATCMYRSLSNNPFSARGVALWMLEKETSAPPRTGGRRRPRDEEPRVPDAPLQEETKQYIHSLVEALGFPFAKNKEADRALGSNELHRNGQQDANLTEVKEEDPKKTRVEHDGDALLVKTPALDTAPPAKEGTAPQSALAKMIQAAKAKQSEKKTTQTDSQAGNSEDDDDDDEDDFGVILPSAIQRTQARHQQHKVQETTTSGSSVTPLAEKHPSQMTREEFLSQFKRPPRPGEIGRSAEEIASAESLGYVMSGSRSKAAQLYMNRIQRQLHEREASQLQQQFRKVEDEQMDEELVSGLAQLLNSKTK